MGKSFLPGRISSLTLSVLMLSVLTPYVSVHVCTGAGRSTCGGTIRFHSGSIIASLTWCLLVPIVVGIMSSVIITKSSKKRTRDK